MMPADPRSQSQQYRFGQMPKVVDHAHVTGHLPPTYDVCNESTATRVLHKWTTQCLKLTEADVRNEVLWVNPPYTGWRKFFEHLKKVKAMFWLCLPRFFFTENPEYMAGAKTFRDFDAG